MTTQGRVEPAATERLRAAGLPGFESILDEKLNELDTSAPGRLVLELEVGRERVPAPERFVELLERAERIAAINAEANPPSA